MGSSTISCIELMVARVNVFMQFICNDNNSTKLRLKLKYTRQNQSFVDNFPRQHEQFPPKSTCFSEMVGTTPEMIMRLLLLPISYALCIF